MRPRPNRLRIRDELGREQTLADGKAQFTLVCEGTPDAPPLLLGLGPDPAQADEASLAAGPPHWGGHALYIECPEFVVQMPPAWHNALPRAWDDATGDEDTMRALIARHPGPILAHRQAMRLFPSFWGPVLAAARLRNAPLAKNLPRPDAPEAKDPPWALLPERTGALLVRELADAFRDHGFTVRTTPADSLSADLPGLLADHGPPRLALCVNGAGIDPYGETYHLLRGSGTRVAVWCVDNPWHILSGWRAPFWKHAPLFVTDASFLPGLRAHGANDAHHLPLATDPNLFTPEAATENPPTTIADLGDLVFVGRSAFPSKQGFFAGCRPAPEHQDAARALLTTGERADFSWWVERSGLAPTNLWPGNAVREAGCGAEATAQAWRAACLKAANDTTSTTVFGDDQWTELVPSLADLRGPVDYYDTLPALYATAPAVLNLTSLLLPAGLTQRHFDVWAAGGFLITDTTPGLDIFPADLVRSVAFRSPADLARRLEALAALAAGDRADLAAQWRDTVTSGHTYAHRIEILLKEVVD